MTSTGWTLKTSSSGRIFYYNRETKEKTFKKPVGFGPDSVEPIPIQTISVAETTSTASILVTAEPVKRATVRYASKPTTSVPHNEEEQAIPVGYSVTPDPRYWLHESGNYYEIATGHFWKWNATTESYTNLSLQGVQAPIEAAVPESEQHSEITIPRLKLVVVASRKLEPRSLLMIDEYGLKFGRDAQDQLIRLQELAVSRYHAHIYFKRLFWLVDVGSTHGTLLNQERLSDTKEASEPKPLKHLDIIQMGSNVFQVHLHPTGFCIDCDINIHPIIPIGDSYIVPVRGKHRVSKKQKLENARVKELDYLKASYGFDQDERVVIKKYNTDHIMKSVRQPLVVPPKSRMVEKATLDTKVEGKGEELLRKMGWKGQGLGVKGHGIVEPIGLSDQKGKRGLGKK